MQRIEKPITEYTIEDMQGIADEFQKEILRNLPTKDLEIFYSVTKNQDLKSFADLELAMRRIQK